MNPTLKGIDKWPNTASLRQLCEAADKSNPGTCSICGSAMSKGMALENSMAGSDDGFGATLSQTGPAEIVDCMKCPTCGHSVHIQDITALPSSIPATPSESPERVETAEEAFEAWWKDFSNQYGMGHERLHAKTFFKAGYDVGRKASEMKRKKLPYGRPVCTQTGKRCFRTHEAALIQGGEDLHRHDMEFVRAYKCEFCNHYHLTTHDHPPMA